MALTRTNPDRSNCTRRGMVEHRANLRLHDREPAAECGIGVRVVSMPRSPVHVARETTTRRDRPSKVIRYFALSPSWAAYQHQLAWSCPSSLKLRLDEAQSDVERGLRSQIS